MKDRSRRLERHHNNREDNNIPLLKNHSKGIFIYMIVCLSEKNYETKMDAR